jgi:transposase
MWAPLKKGQLGLTSQKIFGGFMRSKHQAAPVTEFTATAELALYIGFELSRKKWKLAFSDGRSSRVRIVTITAQDWPALQREIEVARKRYGCVEGIAVRSCYEIGREGFWLHRALRQRGIENVVVDAASIEVNRRKKRAKTDRIDAENLTRQLRRHWRGERVWSLVRVPDAADEDARQLHRDMEVLKREKGRYQSRIESLLFTQGIAMNVDKKFLEKLERLRCWDGKPVPEQLKIRLVGEYQRLQIVQAQLRQLRKQQDALLNSPRPTPPLDKVRRLMQLRALGQTSSWVFVMELFGWRHFANRRQVGGALGLTPTPYQSGDSDHDQGISRSGNRRVRALAVEIAWCWLRFQPNSRLSRWYKKRFAAGGKRMRRIGIVALARRLMIDLWRYLETGIVPEGARLKTV